jgi:hypothetical protein
MGSMVVLCSGGNMSKASKTRFKPLKDFEIVAHVVPVSPPQKINVNQESYDKDEIHALFINSDCRENGGLKNGFLSAKFV